MFELMRAETFVNAAILCTILYLVAKHEADFSFAKVAMVVAAIQLGAFLAQVFLFKTIGWLTLAVSFALALVLGHAIYRWTVTTISKHSVDVEPLDIASK